MNNRALFLGCMLIVGLFGLLLRVAMLGDMCALLFAATFVFSVLGICLDHHQL